MTELCLFETSGELRAGRESEAWLMTWQPAVLWLAQVNTLATRKSYASAVRNFALMTQAPLAEVTVVHTLAFKAAMVSRRLAPRTIRQRLIIITSFFAWCIEAGHYAGPNPARDVPLPRVSTAPVGIALTAMEVEALVDAARTPRDRAVVRLLAGGGLRASELCGLQERDLHVRYADPGHVNGARLLVRHGKGGKSRMVDLDAGVATALAEYLQTGPRVMGATQALFQYLDGSGQGIGYHTVYHVVREAATGAGLGHVAPHDLRRTQITLALDAGEPAPRVQRNAGHSSMAQTVRYYRGG